jgi:hypothetical protein
MRKLLVFLMVVFCMSTAFAQLSIGGGGFVVGNFSTWSVDKDVPGSLSKYNASHLGIGPFIFVDLKYLELNIGVPLSWINADDTMSADPNFPAQTLGLRGSACLKLPVTVSPMFTLFPLLGVDYDLFFLARKEDDRDATFPIGDDNQDAKVMDALNTMWFKTGIGMDTHFTDHLFLRTELMYGLRFPNKMEKYLKDIRQDVNWMLGHGGDFKIAVGYIF